MHKQPHQLFHKIEIGLASPNEIREWAERFLPSGEKVGEITSWETVNYKTLKPEAGGLFCQKIFGPVLDFTCSCGKKSSKDSKIKELVCPKCGVERTLSRVRRYRLGYIKLKQPIVHPLYAAQRPSPISLCMNWSTRRLQAVMLTTEFCSLPQKFTRFRSRWQTSLLFEKRKKYPRGLVLDFLSRSRKQSFGEKQPTFVEKTKLKMPRLFSTKKELKYPRFLFNMNSGEPRLYGFAYDATWRHVEEFQEILFYLWEKPFRYESSLPYYAFTLPIENHNEKIPHHRQSYGIQTGGFVFQHILSHLDARKIQSELIFHDIRLNEAIRINLEKIAALDFRSYEDRKKYKRLRIKINRLKTMKLKCKRQRELFRDFYRTKMQPAWMILSYLPVLPPGLRPITSIRGELVVSDINVLYRKVLIRNKRITQGAHFGVFDTSLSGSWLSWCYNLRQVQQAVDELLKTGSVESGRPLKSLLDTLKGKQGRFRQHLLGKRVDYSGRSVIVVGPQLQIHQCGLPKQMALELFQPFIIQKLRKKGIVVTTTAAKTLIADQKPIVWSILSEILKTHPVLLNRAPTLHRLGIQAFLPQLVEGKAILLHPLVCPAFNADFDGDQMAVHVPLSPKTRAETLTLLWSRNHVLAPASGQPLLLPTQDMVLGFYYLTCSQEKFQQEGLKNETTSSQLELPQIKKGTKSNSSSKDNEYLIPSHQALIQSQNLQKRTVFETLGPTKERFFSSFSQVKKSYDRGFLKLHSIVWVKWPGFVQNFVSEHQAYTKENVIETRVTVFGKIENVFLETVLISGETPILAPRSQYVRTTVGRILMHSWIFENSSRSVS
uniref:DNA-directed RNA polymerase subunit n=1 Tax=Chlorella sorokiniana TaxID=3076 RepID=W8TII7_CHLSO|nr:DNA-directed RNA polymerase subunit beta' [Chlorella sorokiniana]AHM23712.1 DNA-directed RNA polymerase subunit beta' [Chlorella sorokiniana]AII02082.1 RNA polymerase beta [Chlorella sorokiniana]